jgi:hypothetical protein
MRGIQSRPRQGGTTGRATSVRSAPLFPLETVRRVLRLVRMAEFQRKQAAPVLKVTSRAFGTGWRMPIVRQE